MQRQGEEEAVSFFVFSFLPSSPEQTITTTQRLRLMEFMSGCVWAPMQQSPSAKIQCKKDEIKRFKNGVMSQLDDSQQAASCTRNK